MDNKGDVAAVFAVIVFSLALAFTLSSNSQYAVAGHTGTNNTTDINSNITSVVSAAEYNPNKTYMFGVNISNFLCTDGGCMNSTATRFQLGFPNGSLINFTTASTPAVTNSTIGVGNISFNNGFFGAGSYNYTWLAKSSSDSAREGEDYNKTNTIFYNVSKNFTWNVSTRLIIGNLGGGGNVSNQIVTYPETVLLTGNNTLQVGDRGGMTFGLFVDNITALTDRNTAISIQLNSTSNTGDSGVIFSALLPNGTYNVTYNTTGNANYTAAFNNTLRLTVLKGNNSLIVYINDNTSSNNTGTIMYPNAVTLLGNLTNATSTQVNPNFVFNISNSSVMTDTTFRFNISNTTFPSIVLGNGTYQVNFSTAGNENWTNTSNTSLTLMVAKGTVDLLTLINGNTSSNNTGDVLYPNSVVLNGTSTNATQVAPNFVLNVTNSSAMPDSTFRFNLTNSTTGVTSLTFPSVVLGNGTYNINFSTAGNANWTNTSNTSLTLMVAKGTTNNQLFINNFPASNNTGAIAYPNTVTLNGTSTNTSGNTSAVAPLFALNLTNSSVMPTATAISLQSSTTLNTSVVISSVVLGNGTYNLNFSTIANDNWTASSNTSLTLLIVKGTTDGLLFIDDSPASSSSTIYNASVNLNGTATNMSQVNPSYTLNITNSSVMPSATAISIQNTTSGRTSLIIPAIRLGNGTYQINYTTVQNANWSATSNTTLTLVVNKGRAFINLTLNQSAANITIGNGTRVNISAVVNNTEGTIQIYNVTTLYNTTAGASLINQSVIWAGAPGTVYNITAFYPQTANYTQNTSLSFFILIDSTGPVLIVYNSTHGQGGLPGNASFYKSGDNVSVNVSVTDTTGLPAAGFNVTTEFTTNITVSFANNFTNSTAITSLTIFGNGSFLVPASLSDGNQEGAEIGRAHV